MGNAHCKPKWGRAYSVYKSLIDNIFDTSHQHHRFISVTKIEKKLHKRSEKMHVSATERAELEAHVHTNIKPLIDYLERNNNKLADSGNYLSQIITKSSNPEVHVIGLLIIRALLEELKKFSYDKDLVSKMMGNEGLDNTALTGEEKRRIYKFQVREDEIVQNPDLGLTEFDSDIMGNILQFQTSVAEVLAFILDRKRNPLFNETYDYAIQVVNLYAVNHVGWLPAERIEFILVEALEIIKLYSDVHKRESLEKNDRLLGVLANLAKIPNLFFSFKFRLLQFCFTLLRSLYQDKDVISNENIAIHGDMDLKQCQDKTKRKAFQLLEAIAQNISDANEFEVFITPIFSFFDEFQWQEEQLQNDIFSSFLTAMKHNVAFEQAEVFLLERIVDYLNYNQLESYNNQVLYKHNQEYEVKVKVFSVLEILSRQWNRTFMSFLLIDKSLSCFLNNLEDRTIIELEDKRLKGLIYACSRNFIQKLGGSSKSLVQVINSIVAQLAHKCQNPDFSEDQASEVLAFAEFTIESIGCFPSQTSIPKNTLLTLLRLRSFPAIMFSTFPVIEKLLCLSYSADASPTSSPTLTKPKKLAPCQVDVVYPLLLDNLATLSNLIQVLKYPLYVSKLKKERLNPEADPEKIDSRLIGFFMHCIKVNISLLRRKDLKSLVVQVASIRKLMIMSQSQLQIYEDTQNARAKENSGLLMYLVLNFIKNISQKWNFTSLQSHTAQFEQRMPKTEAEILVSNRQGFTKEEVDKVYQCFDSFAFTTSDWYEEEYAYFLELIKSELKKAMPSLPDDQFLKNFDELDPHNISKDFNLTRDEESPNLKNIENKTTGSFETRESMPTLGDDNIKRRANRKDSLDNFGKVMSSARTPKPTLSQKNTFDFKQESSPDNSILDASFKKALKEVRNQKGKENDINLQRILQEDIY